VKVGNTGISPTFLAQGCGYNGSARSSDHTRLGTEAFDRLLQHGVDSGIGFIDTADLYGTHTYVRNTLRKLPREKFALLSKIWPRREYWNLFSGGATEEVNRFRRELGVDMIDICLIHCMQNDKWTDEYARVRDELSQLKEKKVVRAVGVSCHDLGALKVAAASPWVDVIFARINNKGGGNYAMDGSLEQVVPVLKTARANGKFVVGMKIFAAGKLIKPEEKDASLKYVISNRLVDAITIGMKKVEEVDDTLARVDAALKA
jgi:aryl-alcohol dehydrogenase-like predicted oxidoreductase